MATIDLSVGTKMNVNIKWADKTVAATVNGVEIPLDTFNNDQLPTIDPVFPDHAYIAVSGQTGAKMAQFTLE
ncbi:hypothetical protein [Paenibacillus sp. GXUN7292]|uniref:hypothetical protein n=1 Tax=Paenibacillus sp. GXUN7292 TaxID=3422499 RepID=UPI003D7C97F7